MRLLIRLTVVAIVSCGLGAALWAVLQFFADADLDVTVPAAAAWRRFSARWVASGRQRLTMTIAPELSLAPLGTRARLRE